MAVRNQIRIAILQLLVGCIAFTYATVAQAERYNPFHRDTAQQPRSAMSISSTTTPSRIEPREHPRLKAVLQADAGSLANLDGVVLKVGESHQGYRLLDVQEHSATFAYGIYKVQLAVAAKSAKELP